MKNVYRYDKSWAGVYGWILAYKAKSFDHACKIAMELELKTGKPHCVNK